MIEPINDVVAIKLQIKSKGSISLPDSMKNTGQVQSMGEGSWEDGCRTPMSIGVGDTVIFEGEGVEYDDIILVRYDQILAKI